MKPNPRSRTTRLIVPCIGTSHIDRRAATTEAGIHLFLQWEMPLGERFPLSHWLECINSPARLSNTRIIESQSQNNLADGLTKSVTKKAWLAVKLPPTSAPYHDWH